MPWNGSGTATRIYNWVNDKNANIDITASRMDGDSNDFVSMINNTLCKDGQNSPIANLPMATYRHTGVGNAVARTDYAATGQVQDDTFTWGATSTGSANAHTITPSPAIAAYSAGQRFRFIAGYPNSGATTLAVSGLATKNIYKLGAAGPVALVGGEIVTNNVVTVQYDGIQFQITDSLSLTGTVNSGTANQLSYYATSTNAVSGNANATITNGDAVLGQTSGPVQGSLKLWGATSGSIQVKPAAVAGTGTVLTLPATTGTALTTADANTAPLAVLAQVGTHTVLGNSTSGTANVTAAYTVGTSASNLVQLDGSAKLPAVDGSQLTGLTPSPFSKKYTSTEQTWTSAGTLTLAHSLGAIPFGVLVYLKNVTGEGGYSTGDVLAINPDYSANSSGSGQGLSIVPDATNLNIKFGSSGSGPTIIRKDTGALIDVTPANWSVSLRVWL